MLSAGFRSSTTSVPHILRLQPEIGGMFVDEMDIMSLTMWRLTCKTNYYQAVGSLHRSLTKMLDHFVPNPVDLLSILNKSRGVIGGEFTLAFILRDPSMLPKWLDLYASDQEFNALRTAILGNISIERTITQQTCTHNTVLDALRTLVSSVVVIQTTKGTSIHIHRSYTTSSTAPISRASCTALSNFVTAHGFGCSHPLLTLNRRALLADQDLPQPPVLDPELQDTLIKHNFSLAFSPIAWAEFRRPVVTNALAQVPPTDRHPLATTQSPPLNDDIPTMIRTGVATSDIYSGISSALPHACSGVGDGSVVRYASSSTTSLPTLDGGASSMSSITDDGRLVGVAPIERVARSPARCDVDGGGIANTFLFEVVTQFADVVSPSPRGLVSHGHVSSDVGAAEYLRASDGMSTHTPMYADGGHFPPDLPTTPVPACFESSSTGAHAAIDGDRSGRAYIDNDILRNTDASHRCARAGHGDDHDVIECASGSAPTLDGVVRPSPLADVYTIPAVPIPAVTMPCAPPSPYPSTQSDGRFVQDDATSGMVHPVEVLYARAQGGVSGDNSARGVVTSHTTRGSEPASPRVRDGSLSPVSQTKESTTVRGHDYSGDDLHLFSTGDDDTAPWRRRHTLDLHCIRTHLGRNEAPDADMPNGAAGHVELDGEGTGEVADASNAADATAGSVDEHVEGSDAGGVDAVSDDEASDGEGLDDTDTEHEHIDAEQCWRHLYICPSQGRYFGDRGSLVDFFDPLNGCENYCAWKGIAPFGPMVVWRVLSTFNCEEGCDIYDDVLEEGVTSILVIFRKDPFGELRDAGSDLLAD